MKRDNKLFEGLGPLARIGKGGYQQPKKSLLPSENYIFIYNVLNLLNQEKPAI